jgi:hypothetical protein
MQKQMRAVVDAFCWCNAEDCQTYAAIAIQGSSRLLDDAKLAKLRRPSLLGAERGAAVAEIRDVADDGDQVVLRRAERRRWDELSASFSGDVHLYVGNPCVLTAGALEEVDASGRWSDRPAPEVEVGVGRALDGG